MTYTAAENRYDSIPYRRVGRSGLVLPALSLGLWHNFGDSTPIDTQRSLLRTAFDLGINHFDLANNYGPPYGSAEINFGRLTRTRRWKKPPAHWPRRCNRARRCTSVSPRTRGLKPVKWPRC
jgi:hypothetical protein